jgi:hypothetical protein
MNCIHINASPLHRGNLAIPVAMQFDEPLNLFLTPDSDDNPQNQTSSLVQVIAPADTITGIRRNSSETLFEGFSPTSVILAPGDSLLTTAVSGDLYFLPLW